MDQYVAPELIDRNPWNYPQLIPLINHREPICEHDFTQRYPGVVTSRVRIPQPCEPPYIMAVEGCYICGHATNGIYVYLMSENTNRMSRRIPR